MKLNSKIALVGQGVVLVPYRPEHVPKYHQWMCDPKLLAATASDPLTLEEEYVMQQNWERDDDKLTFIILVRPDNNQDGDLSHLSDDDIRRSFPMVGDVNLFLTENDSGGRQAEVEVMVAEENYRQRTIAYNALQILLSYATSPDCSLRLHPYNFFVKVAADNVASLSLFKKLGFLHTSSELDHFGELKMWAGRVSWDADYDMRDWP